MQCEKCHAELAPNSISCPECGAPVIQTIKDFETTPQIQIQLMLMIKEHEKTLFITNGGKLYFDGKKFTALLNDYIAEYEKERKLLRRMVDEENILGVLLSEPGNHEMAITKARSVMLGEKFLSESAAEFVLACITFMLGWPYDSPLRVKEKTGEEEEEHVEKKRAARMDDNIFMRTAAAKFRLLARNVTIPDGVTMIEGFCFDGFGNIRTVELPDTLIGIGEYAFSECKHLRAIELPASLRFIGKSAFTQCERLVGLKLPRGILEIAEQTFFFCKALETVDIPDTVSSIGEQAFAGCEHLRRLTLPDSVKFIDKNAFALCPRLTIRCIENSYVFKYCLANAIPFEAVTAKEL